MIDLVTQDRIDGSSKVAELRSGIMREYSDNRSSTGRSVLLAVSACGKECLTREVRSAYNDRVPNPETRRQPSWLVWNGMFY